MRRLFLGGESAGQEIEILYPSNTVKVPKRKEAPVYFSTLPAQAIKVSDDFDIYRLQKLHNQERIIEVYCLEGLNPIDELLSGYNPKKAEY